jgi:signal peptidase II
MSASVDASEPTVRAEGSPGSGAAAQRAAPTDVPPDADQGAASEPAVAQARPGDALRRWLVFFGLATGVVVLDQASKAWIESAFALASTHGPVADLAEPTPILGDLVRIAKIYNDGGIFGLFDATAPVLALASLAVIGVLVVVQARSGPRASWWTTIALGLLLGGAIGNLVDRIRFGYVIDWVDMGIGGWRFYTFNVADSAISIAIVMMLAAAILGPRLAGGSER